jgi:PKD repeat protein
MTHCIAGRSTTRFIALIITIYLFVGGRLLAQPLSGILPKYDSYVHQPNVPFEWNAMPGAVNYNLVIASDPAFTQNVIQSPPLTVTNWTSTTLSFGTWYWKVVGSDGVTSFESGTNRFVRFDPSQIASLSFWVKADSGIGLDASNRVETWQDLSPNSFSLTQSTASKRPFVNTVSYNGLPSIEFQGAQVLSGGDILDLGTSSRRMFIVGQFGGNDQTFFAKSNGVSAPSRYAFMRLGSQTTVIYQESADNHLFCPTSSTVTSLWRFDSNRTNNSNQVNLNNQSIGTKATVPFYNMQSSFRFLVGAFNGANDVGELFYLNGNISEMVFIDTDNSTQINDVQNYLKHKYHAPLNLEADIAQTNYCNTTLTSPPGFTNLLWSTGATTSSISVDQNGDYWVRGTDPFGFVWYDTIRVTYPTIPPPTYTGICVGQSNTWNADMGPGFTYLWSTGATTPSIDISTPGTYSVTVTGAGGCSRNSGNYTFTIDNYENTAFLGNDTVLCSGNPIALQVGAAETVEYFWNGLSTSDQPSSWEVDTTGNYFLESVNVNGCVARDTIFVDIIGVAPEANFSAANFCLGDATQFNDLSIAAGSDPLVSWNWNFGDGNNASSANPMHSYSAAGNYSVNLYVESDGGCGAQIALPVTIVTPPTANFNSSQKCSAETTLFSDVSIEGSAGISAWLWNFGNPSLGLENVSSQQHPGRQYGTPGNYNVYLQVSDNNGCTDDTLMQISISQSPLASFNALDHCAGSNIQFTNTSSIPSPDVIANYLWDFGDNTFSLLPTPNKTFFNSGFHTLTLTATASNGCSNSIQQQVFTHANPVPAISVGPACAGNWTYISDVSTVVTGTVAQSDWEIDLIDQLTGTSVAYMFQTTGSHNIELISTSDFGCTGDTMIIINVQPGVTPNFSSFPEVFIAGEAVEFTNLSTGQTNILWDFGDGNNSTELNPSHVYDAIWTDSSLTVTLTASNALGCSGTSTQTFTVNRPYFDLAINNIFLTESNGFYTVGVELKNAGTSVVEEADVILRMSNGTQLMDRYENVLQSGETAIMIFDAMPSAFLSDQNETEEYICAEAIPYSALNLQDEDLNNNTFCKNLEGSAPVLIGPDPNPATQQFHFSVLISTESVVTVDLTDSRGRIVKRFYEDATLSKGLYSVSVPLHDLQSGVYTLRMISGDSAVTRRLLVTEE